MISMEKNRCEVCHNYIEFLMFIDNGVSSNNKFHIQCAMLQKTVKHDRHSHKLTLHVNIEKEKDYIGCYCDLCEEERDVDSWLYYCANCEVAGHLSCGLLGKVPPSKGILTSNPVYTEKREKLEVGNDNEESLAPPPGKPIETVIREQQKSIGDLVHFSHEHPLFLYDDIWDTLKKCRACGICVYGKTYICGSGCEFYLHKWCAELPKEVHFGFHLEHPLTLLSMDSLGCCSYCGGDNKHFSFSCLKCGYYGFHYHTTCAFLYEFEQSKHHGHPLKPKILSNYNEFENVVNKIIPAIGRKKPPCSACMYLCDDTYLGCDECSFYLHVGCSLYPPTGKAKTHMHNLDLTYNFQEDPYYYEFYCDACEKPRIPGRWVYRCPDAKCVIVSHLDCGVPNLFATASFSEHENDNIACCCEACEKERDPNDWIYYRPCPSLYILNGLQETELDRPIHRILRSEPKYALLKANVPKPEEKLLEHFSHLHRLVLRDEKLNCEIKCEACSRCIYGETYICLLCGYYLHKWCAQIPQQMHFKFHPQNPLTLLSGHRFECYVCGINSSGFSFSCEICNFEAHTQCALMPERGLEIHKHHSVNMILYTTSNDPNLITTCKFPVRNGEKPLCEACRFPCEGMTIECRHCNFYLHISCAWYPRTRKTEAHTHALTLGNDAADFTDEGIPFNTRHLCDVCNKTLSRNCWGYICTDEKCNHITAHLDCAVPNPFLTSSFDSILVHQEPRGIVSKSVFGFVFRIFLYFILELKSTIWSVKLPFGV